MGSLCSRREGEGGRGTYCTYFVEWVLLLGSVFGGVEKVEGGMGEVVDGKVEDADGTARADHAPTTPLLQQWARDTPAAVL